jgi:hypothetical protein
MLAMCQRFKIKPYQVETLDETTLYGTLGFDWPFTPPSNSAGGSQASPLTYKHDFVRIALVSSTIVNGDSIQIEIGHEIFSIDLAADGSPILAFAGLVRRRAADHSRSALSVAAPDGGA